MSGVRSSLVLWCSAFRGRVRRGGAVCVAVLVLAPLLVVAAGPGSVSAQALPTPNPDGTYTVPRDWPLRPAGISPGTTFRLLFLTTRWEPATSTDIAAYDAIVQGEVGKTSGNPNQIGHPAIRPYASLFRVVGSTATVDARDHTNMNPDTDGRGEHIFWLNGPLVATSYNTFWRDHWENWAEADRRDQAGTQSPNDWPWTGTNHGGTKSTNPLGHNSRVTQGQFKANSGDTGPLNHTTAPRMQMHSFYGISPVFVVEPHGTLEPVFGPADPSKTTVEVLHSSYEGVVRYSFDGIDPYNRNNKYEDDRPGVSFLVGEAESCMPEAGVDTVIGGITNYHPDPSTYGEYRKLTYTVKLVQPPPTHRNAVVAIFGPDDKHPRDRKGFRNQYDEIFKKQLAVVGRTSPMRGMGNQLPMGRVTVPTSRLSFSATDWNVAQEVEVWVRCANSHNPWEDIHIFHGVYPQGTTGALGAPPTAAWFEVTVTVIDANTSPRPADLNSADAYPGRVHVHLESPGGGFNAAGGNWQVPINLHWRTARIDAFQAGDAADRLKVNDAAAAMGNFRKFEVKVEGMAKGMSDPRSDGMPTHADGDRLPTTLTWDVSPEKLVSGRGDPFENYYPAYFLTPDLTKDSVVHSPGSPIYRVTVTPYSIRGFRVPGEAVQQCIHVRTPGEDPVTGAGATENKYFYLVACPSNFPDAPASQLEAVPPMLTISTAAQSVDEGADATFTISADPVPLLDTTVNVYVSQEMGEGLDYVGREEATTITLPAGQRSVDWTVTAYSDDIGRADGTIGARINPGDTYGVTNPAGVAVPLIDDDGGADDDAGPALDPQLEADVRSYAAETHHGELHVNRWKRVLEAFGLESYPDLEPTTLDEARAHVDIGRPRWIPVLAHMIALDAVNPQPALTPANVQVDAQVLATARSRAGQTHRGAAHVNRWKRVLEAFGEADYPNLEPMTAAAAQVYANVWSDWGDIAAQLRLIEAAATTVPPVVEDPEVSIAAGAGVTEGGDASFTLTADPAPTAGLAVTVTVTQNGDYGVSTGQRTVTIPTGGTATLTVATSDDSTDETDGSVTATINTGNGYTVHASQGTGTVAVADNDDVPSGYTVDPGVVAQVQELASQTQHGADHVNRWQRVLVAFGVLDAAGVAGGAMTVAQAQQMADSHSSPVWDLVVTELTALGTPPQTIVPPVVEDPEVSIAAGAGVTEGGDASFTLTADPAPTAGLAVTVTVTQNGDYGVSTGQRTVTIPTGGTATLTVATSDDSTDETDGSVTATINTGNGYTVHASQGTGTVAVADNDDPPPVVEDPEVSIAAGAGVTEGGDASFTLTADPAPTAGLAVTVTVTQNGDYGVSTGQRTVTIPTGGTATLTVATSDDSTDETDGSVTATINTGNGYTVHASQGTGTVAVADNDDPPPVVEDPEVSIAAGAGVTEGGDASFTLTADPAPTAGLAVTVTVTQNGDYGVSTGQRTVTIPTGGTATLTVATSDDSTDETDGSVTATINTGNGYTVHASQGTGTVAVADNDDPPPVVEDPEVSIAAGAGVTEGGDASFTLTADPAPTAGLAVTVTVTQNGDYGVSTGQRTVTIPTGGTATLTVATSDDSTDETDGSVTATINTGNGYTVHASQGTGTVAVADNDDPPPTSSVTVSVDDASGTESGHIVAFLVTLSEASTEEITVRFTTWAWPTPTNRAHRNIDYEYAERELVFWPGQTEWTVPVWLINDSRSEPDEYFTVELTNPQGATIDRGKATGTIVDDD